MDKLSKEELVRFMRAFPRMRTEIDCWGWEYVGAPCHEWLVYEPGMDWRCESLDFGTIEDAAGYILNPWVPAEDIDVEELSEEDRAVEHAISLDPSDCESPWDEEGDLVEAITDDEYWMGPLARRI